MRPRCLAIFLLLAATLVAPGALHAAAPAQPIIPFDDVAPGMKGYGMSVFRGHKPERFEVEVIGRIPKRMPDQGLIIVRLKGQDLERSGTVAGMSGSPIYLDGRLAGALAYAWGFALDPIAGITPIEAMLTDLDRKQPPLGLPAAAERVRAAWGPYLADGDLAAAIGRLGLGGGEPGADAMRPVGVPVSVPALPDDVAAAFATGLRRAGLTAVTTAAAAGASSSAGVPTGPGEDPTGTLVDGGVLGVAFLLGDLTMAGVGTVTHVVGDRLVGFGHPFMQAGPVDFPMLDSRILLILANSRLSFKMAAPGPIVGRLVGDYQASVVGRLDERSRLVPIAVTIDAPDAGVDKTFRMEAAPMPPLFPLIAAAAVGGAMKQALPHVLPYRYKVEVEWQAGAGRQGRHERTLLAGAGGAEVLREVLQPLILVLGNPYEPLPVTGLEVRVEAVPEQRVATVRGLALAATEVRAGGTLAVPVRLRAYGARDDTVTTLRLPIPASLAGRSLTLRVGSAAALLRPPQASPTSLDGWLRQLDLAGRADELAVVLEGPAGDLDHGGVIFPAAPPSLRAALPADAKPKAGAARPAQHVVRQQVAWVLEGEAKATLEILPPDGL